MKDVSLLFEKTSGVTSRTQWYVAIRRKMCPITGLQLSYSDMNRSRPFRTNLSWVNVDLWRAGRFTVLCDLGGDALRAKTSRTCFAEDLWYVRLLDKVEQRGNVGLRDHQRRSSSKTTEKNAPRS